MDRGGFFVRPGLLGLLLLYSLSLYGKELSVLVWTSPENPVRGSPWTVSILVAHPVPSEVAVRPPELPPALTLERVRTEPRLARWASNERWTAVEFSFIPHRAGEFLLNAFEISTPGNRARTSPLVFRVRREDGIDREYRPRLQWELLSPPEPLREGMEFRTGEAAELALVLSDWDPRLSRPGGFSFSLAAMEQAVLEELPVSAPEAERGIVSRLRIIPLEETDLSLTFPHVHYSGVNLEIPGIRILITPDKAETETGLSGAAGGGAADLSSGAVPEAVVSAAVSGGTAGAFPERPPPLLFRGAYRRNAGAARALWDQGRRPEALALLRKNEGDRLAGFTLAPLRQEAEQVLGIADTEDEKRRPPVRFLLVIIAASIPPGILGITYLKKRVTSGRSWCYKCILAVSALILCAGLAGLADRFLDRAPRAVLRSCTAYRVPDVLGTEEFRFPEGLPAVVRAEADSWVYVESAEGNAGWVLRENLVYY
ncbi:MAG: hypothetical protein LBQ14_01600 [Treponema sp.]|nr:hypothetical protein [Treponema sp.]